MIDHMEKLNEDDFESGTNSILELFSVHEHGDYALDLNLQIEKLRTEKSYENAKSLIIWASSEEVVLEDIERISAKLGILGQSLALISDKNEIEIINGTDSKQLKYWFETMVNNITGDSEL